MKTIEKAVGAEVVITCLDGRWGIQNFATGFTPAAKSIAVSRAWRHMVWCQEEAHIAKAKGKKELAAFLQGEATKEEEKLGGLVSRLVH